MIPALLNISFIFIIFCIEIGVFPFLPNNISDPFIAKEFMALFFALSISFLTLHKYIISFHNKWILISLLYILIHPFLVSKLDFGNPVDNQIYQMAIYHPLAQIIIYSLFLFAVSSINFSKKNIDCLLKIFYYSAIITSVYCIFQYFGMDDRQFLNSNPNTYATSGKSIVGFMSHPNQCGIFLVSMLPFVWCRKKIMVILLISAIAMTQSLVAYVGVGVFLLFLTYKYINKHLSFFILLGCVVMGLCLIQDNPSIASGRTGVWKTAINLLISGPDGRSHILFGYGFGSYKPLIVGLMDMKFIRMHCDPLQWFFETGIIGMGLLIFSLKWLIEKFYNTIIIDERVVTFAMSFLLLLICSLGSFVFQVEPHRYLGVFLLGYLHNLARRKI